MYIYVYVSNSAVIYYSLFISSQHYYDKIMFLFMTINKMHIVSCSVYFSASMH